MTSRAALPAVDLRTECGGVSMRTPIMPASGTFSSEMGELLDLSQLGALVLKTTTPEPRTGNAVPRVSEVNQGLLNSIGLPGRGSRHFVEEVLPEYLTHEAPVIVSISAPTARQFGEMARELTLPGVAGIEVNVSCPNVEADGKAFAMSPSATEAVLSEVRQATSLPLWAKLTPNTAEIADIGFAAQESGADAVVVANTILAMSIDVLTRTPSLGNVMGGLSGPAVKPIILRMVYQCASRLSIPVIGCGGISSGLDAAEFLLAGATSVQVGTASFVDPMALVQIEEELVAYCQGQGFLATNELVGALELDDQQAKAASAPQHYERNVAP